MDRPQADPPQARPPATALDDHALRGWPLPMPASEGDKEERGRVLIVGGSPEIVGAIVLAAVAALRAGAGKVAIATAESIAPVVSVAVPEARVVGLPQTPGGGLTPAGIDRLGKLVERLDALLVGPGMQDEAAACELAAALLSRLDEQAGVMLDAAAMGAVSEAGPRRAQPILVTPHAGEMAHLTGADKDAIQADPLAAAREAAARWNAVVALKGAVTHIVMPDGTAWRHEGGSIGLATSGSGDTLAGIIAGLMARGAPIEQACAWGVALHARAGQRLAERIGPLGFLAREIPREVPALLHALSGDGAAQQS